MSRRDTIIIAVLVNAGILLVLFALAMPSKESSEKSVGVAFEKPEALANTEASDLVLASALGDKNVAMDEIDQVLSEWNEQSQIAPTILEASDDTNAVVYPLEAQEVKEASSVVKDIDVKSDKTVEVVVKKGDALDKIARAHGTSASDIMKLNHLSSTKLQIGQVLLVPDTGKAKAKSSSKTKSGKAKSETKSEAKGDLYTVKSGDNPWTIANKNHIKLEELLKLNDLNEDSAKKLKPGDKIRIK